MLNDAQKQAVEYTEGPLLIVAGAGTGKTTVITQKIAYLIENKLAKPEEILALTFTEKASEEMQTRVDELINLGYAEMQISTFHAFGQKLLEHHALDIGLPNQFKLLTETDAWLLIRKNLDKFNLDYYRPLGNPARHIHELVKHFSKCKDELITPEEYLKYAEEKKLDTDNAEYTKKAGAILSSRAKSRDPLKLERKGISPLAATLGRNDSVDSENGIDETEIQRLTEVANAYHVYNQLLLENNALDFGDLIFYTIKLLEKRPHILEFLQKRFKYILVDEFQDVNWAQYYLVQMIADKKSQLTVVGDDDQAIYAFRGASVSNIMHFKDDFKNAKEVVLTENYRSGQEILDLAYKSIQNNNPDRLEVKLGVDKKLKCKVESVKCKVAHIHSTTLDDETRAVADEIIRLKEIDKEAVWDDFAILVRANNHAEPFLNILEKRGIPYEFLASAGLYRQPIVLDCLNFLQATVERYDSPAIYRLLNLPCWHFPDEDLQKITNWIRSKKFLSFFEALKRAGEISLSTDGQNVANKIMALLAEGAQKARVDKPTTVLYNFLEKSGYLQYLTHAEEQGNRGIIRQIYQLKQFFDEIKAFEINTPDAKTRDFLEHFNFISEAGDKGSLHQPTDTPDSVNILTIHAAKGLEFKYVFVVNLVEDRFPSRARGEAIEIPLELVKEQLPEGDSHIEEERRLFYVAMTRAKKGLYFMSATDYGGVRAKKISRFLDELGFVATAEKTELVSVRSRNKTCPVLDTGFGMTAEKQNNKSEFVFEIPQSFSFSQLKSYATCPFQYKLANVLKIPLKGSPAFSFGQTMHSTLQEFYKQMQELNKVKQISLFAPSETGARTGVIKTPSLEELLKIYETKWIDDWYESKSQRDGYYHDGQEILKIFYATHENNWRVPISLEGSFKIKIGQYLLSGRIDRVDQLPDGTLEIVDYKTGKAKEKVTGEDKDQLLIYQIAAEQLPQYQALGKPSKLTYYYLNENSPISFLGKDKEKEELESKLVAIIEKIHARDFTATPSQFVCARCEFRGVCDYWV